MKAHAQSISRTSLESLEPRLLLAAVTELISRRPSGTQGNNHSDPAAISASGRYVAFQSQASNLVSGDTNGKRDIFVYDRKLNTIERVSVGPGGVESDGESFAPSISADGRYIVYQSWGTTLVPGDVNNSSDIFLYDRVTKTTRQVSVRPDGGTPNRSSYNATISADGRFIAYDSLATNLVAGDTNNTQDVFVYEVATGKTVRVSVASDGTQGDAQSFKPSLSDDGRYVAFYSYATTLVAGDTNGVSDVFVYDRQTGQTRLVSVGMGGVPANDGSYRAVISGHGRFVAFESAASNLVAGDTNGTGDIFVADLLTGAIERVSVAAGGVESNGYSWSPGISSDGQYVVYVTSATNIVAGDSLIYDDIVLFDRSTGTPSLISVADGGGMANGNSGTPTISAAGGCVAYSSFATNLVAGDANGRGDIFLRDLGGGNPTMDLRLSPSTVRPAGDTITLLGVDVDAPNGWADNIAFYRESNGIAGLQTGVGGDELLGTDTDDSDGWSVSFPSTGLHDQFHAIVTDNHGGTGLATIVWSAPRDRAGNRRADAATIRNPLTRRRRVRDSVTGGDRDDYWKFTIKSAATLRIDLTNLAANAGLYLLDRRGRKIKGSNLSGARSERILKKLARGTYYIRIRSIDRLASNYTLTVRSV